jgi:hypothetical protein
VASHLVHRVLVVVEEVSETHLRNLRVLEVVQLYLEEVEVRVEALKQVVKC